MNILHVIPYFVPAWDYGGPVQILYGAAKEMVRRGHQVTVYASDALNRTGRVLKKREIIDGIEVKRFRNLGNALAYKHKIFLSPGMQMVSSQDVSGFDIIHMHEYRSLQNIIAHGYARKCNIPYVLHGYGGLPRIMSKQRLKQLFDTLWGYRLLKDASQLIALTPTEVEQYKELGVEESKIVQIPNCLDISEYEPLPAKGTFRKEYGITDKHMVLFLARLNRIKGLDILVRATAELVKDLESVKLIIAGPDDGYLPVLREQIKELKIEDKVLLTGFVPKEMKLAAYVDADVYVLPSFYEAFATTVLEAGACGAPVIITDRCHMASLVENKFGLVIPYDGDKLRDTLFKMLTNEKMRKQFGETGKALVREKYNWSYGVQQFEAVYEAAIARRESV